MQHLTVGFTASRTLSRETRIVIRTSVLFAIRRRMFERALVGSAPGDVGSGDHLIRSLLGRHGATVQVFAAENWHTSKLVARSIQLARALIAAPGDRLLIAFPDRPCPPAVRPTTKGREAFNGSGSGTWATTALVAGADVPLVVYLPLGVTPPDDWGVWWEGPIPGWYFRGSPPSYLLTPDVITEAERIVREEPARPPVRPVEEG